MMFRSKPVGTRYCLLSAALVTAFAGLAFADGGYFAGSKGARVAGRGGAFVVKADDVMASAINPAGLARLDGTTVQVGNRFSHHGQSYERQPTLDWAKGGTLPPYVDFAKVDNGKPWMLLDPLLGVTTDFGLDDFGFAFLAYAPPGVREQEFPVDGGQRYMLVSRQGEILNYGLSASWKYKDLFGIGATFQWLYLRSLDVQIVIEGEPGRGEVNPVEGQYDLLSTITVSDPFTPQAIVGAWVSPTPWLQFAASGQVIPTQWEAKGTLQVSALNVDEQPVLVRLKNGLEPVDDVTMVLPLPLTARAGVRFVGLEHEKERFDVELDVVYETWSRVDHLTIDSDDMSAQMLGQDIPIGTIEVEKQWENTLGLHLGGDYVVLPELLTARVGTYYETAVAPPEYANVDFSSGEHVGFGLGSSIFVGPVEAALGYEFRHQLERKVTEGDGKVYQIAPASLCEPPYTGTACHAQYQGQPAPTVNGGRYQATSHSLSLDLRYRF